MELLFAGKWMKWHHHVKNEPYVESPFKHAHMHIYITEISFLRTLIYKDKYM